MKFKQTELQGLWIIESEPFVDIRGSFSKTFCAREFENRGLNIHVVNTYITTNYFRGTLRGMHYQAGPYAEDKLVRCVVGQIFDVAVDLRTDSKTYRQWFGLELSEDNHQALYIPMGCAHGFITLRDNTMLQYQVSNFFEAQAECGLRWDDPAIGIKWPIEPQVISEKDRRYSLL